MPQHAINRRLILGSASPRRAELLRQHGYEFDVVVSPVDEPTDFPPGMSPPAIAEYLSHFKAARVAESIGRLGLHPKPGESAPLVLGADTVAALGELVFGKPADRADARRILHSITGVSHQVITGLTLIDLAAGRTLCRHDTTMVHMRNLGEDEMRAYLDSGDWQGKAGAYGIQDSGDRFVDRIEGSFTNVVGLPMELLSEMLRELTGRSAPARAFP